MLEGVVGPRPEVKDIAELMLDALIISDVDDNSPADNSVKQWEGR